MVFLDLPPQLPERVVCALAAAVKYDVPANIVLAVSEKEGGKPGQWVRNTNGTHDVGWMQFNTSYLRGLERYGITVADVAAAGCYAFDLAAWRLRGHLRHDSGDIWTRAANYHSRTPRYNATYRADLRVKAARWADWLDARFTTRDVTATGAALKAPAPPAIAQPGSTTTAIAAPAAPAASARPASQPARSPSVYVPRTLTVSPQS